MTARERCGSHDDGRHRWRSLPPGPWSAEARYGCGPSCGIVLPTGDGIVEDAAFLAPDALVGSCDRCGVEAETTYYHDLGDVVGDLVTFYYEPDVVVLVCPGCSPDEADALAELAEAKAAITT